MSNKEEDYYDLLGLETECTEKQIKKKFRILAMKWHPDLNPDNIEECTRRFALLQQAYETLMDGNERAWYDEHRANPQIDDPSDSDKLIDPRKFMFRKDLYDMDVPDQDEKSFYSVISGIYKRFVEEEESYAAPQKKQSQKKNKSKSKTKTGRKQTLSKYPTFGDSRLGKKKVLDFYDFWGKKFKSKKTFSWVDPYQTKDAKNRYMRKNILKENEKQRKTERAEFSKHVRDFTNYIKKRDPRQHKLLKQKFAKKREKLEKDKLLSEILDLENEFGDVSSSEEGEGEKQLVDESDESEGEEEEEEEVNDLDDFFSTQETRKKDKKETKNIYAESSSRKRKKRKLKNSKKSKNQQQESSEEKEKKKKNNEKEEKPIDEKKDSPFLKDSDSKSSHKEAEKSIDEEIEETENLLFGGESTKNSKISKREKRKIKRKIRKQNMKKIMKCRTCEMVFTSRSKLFKHLKSTGHTQAT